MRGGACIRLSDNRSVNDIEQATKLSRAMITRYGMSSRFGMVALETQSNPYLGGDSSLSCSPETAATIDDMVVDMVKQSYEKARKLLKDNQGKLHELAKYLYEKETITGDEFMRILSQKELLQMERLHQAQSLRQMADRF